MHRGKAPLTSRYTPCETDYGLRLRLMARTHNGVEPARLGWTQWCGVHRWAGIGISGGRSAAINYHQYASYAMQRPVHQNATTDAILQDWGWRNEAPYGRYYLMSYWFRWAAHPVSQFRKNVWNQDISIPEVDCRAYAHTYFIWGVKRDDNDGSHAAQVNWWYNWISGWSPQSNIDERIFQLPSNAFIRAMRDPSHPLYYRFAHDLTETYLNGDRREIQAFLDTWRRALPDNIYAGWQNPLPGATKCLFSHSGIIIVKRIAYSSFRRVGDAVVYDQNGTPQLTSSPVFVTQWIQHYHPLGWNPQDPASNAARFWVDDDGDLVPWVVWCIDEVVDANRRDAQNRPEPIYFRFHLQHLDWGWTDGRAFRTLQLLGKNIGTHWTDAIQTEPDARTRAIAKRYVNRLVEQMANIHGGEPLSTPLIGATGVDLREPVTPEGNPRREVAYGDSHWQFDRNRHITTLYGTDFISDDKVRRLRTLRDANGNLDWSLVRRIPGFMWDNMGNILAHYPTLLPTQRPNGTAAPTMSHTERYEAEVVFRQALWMNHHALLLKAMNEYLAQISPHLANLKWEFNSFSVPEMQWLFPRFTGFSDEQQRAQYLWSPIKANPRAGQNGQTWFAQNGNNVANATQFRHWLESMRAFNTWFAFGFLNAMTYEYSPLYYYVESTIHAGDPYDERTHYLFGALNAGHGIVWQNTPYSFWGYAQRYSNFVCTRLLIGIGMNAVYWRIPELSDRGKTVQGRFKRAAAIRLSQLLSNFPSDWTLPTFHQALAHLHNTGTGDFPTSWVNEWLTAAPGLGVNTTINWRERIGVLEQHGANVLLSHRRPFYYSPQQVLTRLKPFVVWHPYSPYQGNYQPRIAVNANNIVNYNPGQPTTPPTSVVP